MVPDLWRCGGNPLLDFGGLLLHPLGLAALLSAWGILEVLPWRRGAAFVRRLLIALSLLSLGLAGFLLHVTAAAALIGLNPTWFVEASQYVAIIGAGITVRVQLRREWSGASAPSKRRSRRLPQAAALLGMVGVFFFATGPFFGENSALSLFRFPRWLFEVSTTALATDECLARRGVELPAPLFLPHEPDRVTTPYEWNFDLGAIARPSAKAYKVLAGRGPSTMPAITRGLERVLARANAEEERRAVRFLMLVARWSGGHHPILDAWGAAPHQPPGRELVEGWRVCLEMNRRDRVGSKVNARCDFPK